MGLALSKTPEFQFRRRYTLAPTDPRFLDCTLEEIVTDLWAHAFADDPKREGEEVVSTGFEDDLAAAEAAFMAEREKAPTVTALGSDDWETVVDDHY